MDDENDGNNVDRDIPQEEDGAIRRNQVLIFGVVLLGILAICLAVTMPSDLEFSDTDLTSTGAIGPEIPDRPAAVDMPGQLNQTNSSTIRKTTLRNAEVSVEVKLLRDMAIQRKIKEYDNSNNYFGDGEAQTGDDLPPSSSTKEELEEIKVNSIVETFIGSEDFEDFLIDMEIHDAVRKLREQKGYKGRSTTIFDELFKRAEKEFIGEDEEELQLIRRVREEIERRAWEVISARKKTRGQDLTEPEELIANELLKLEYSGSGEEDGEIIEIMKTEL